MQHFESRSHRGIRLCLLLALPLSLACAKQAADTAPPAQAPSAAAEPAGAEDRDTDANVAGIVIDPAIAKMCSIPTAHFDFDSSALGHEARGSLDALAACFVDGPAAGKSMRLVGHADPRGTEEYNLALGQRRAGSVADYLSNKALDESRLETSSRGELDASGTDESSWVRDRKVEILLAE